jgi:gamma-butyrobetaine dioxygenase
MTPATGSPATGSPAGLIAGLFAGQGGRDYLGEAVSLAVHMLQSAALAEAAAAPPPLVVAALLHDVGHFALPGGHARGFLGDDRHEQAGAAWLAQWFPAEVTEPIRLHVPAKRYLCAVEPAYLGTLSAASVYTLSQQGGPMSPAGAAAFEALPHADAAVAVRRWDDQAKDPAAPVPPFTQFGPLLDRLAGF